MRGALVLSLALLTTGIAAAQAAAPDKPRGAVISACLNVANPEVAIAACGRIIELFPNLPPRQRAIAFYNRGFAQMNNGALALAVEDLSSAIALDDGNATYRFVRGVAQMKLNHAKQAAADFTAAIQRGDKRAAVFSARGVAFEKSGNAAAALADYTRAAEIDPVKKDYAEAVARLSAMASAQGAGDTAMPPEKPTEVAKTQDTQTQDTQTQDTQTQDSQTQDVQTAAATGPTDPASNVDATPTAVDPAAAGTRVALVIGNSAYAKVPRLENPQRDADKVAETLRSVGFSDVEVADDLDVAGFAAKLRSFAKKASQADWAVVYYAGHGIEIDSANYLVPIDATLASDRDVKFEAVALDQVLAAVEGAKQMRLVILDACRENPFEASMKRAVGTRAVTRGLARVEPEGGTMVVYSAKAGQVAADGSGQNSPFVSALTRRIAEPGVEIGKLFRLVRDDVLKATDRRQEPFVYGSLPADDVFINPPRAAAAP